MVNTFLLHDDFRRSAALLDRQRLGKQRVEAYQILLVIIKYRFLAQYYGLDDFPVGVDTSTAERKAWVDKVMTTFKSARLGAILVRNNIVIEYPKGTTLPHVAKSGNHLFYDSATGIVYETSGKRSKIVTYGPWHQYVQTDELYVIDTPQIRAEAKTNRNGESVTDYYLNPSLGSGKWQKLQQTADMYIVPAMRTGPMINLWLGFEEALKDYVNAHIEMWLARGYKNNMKTYHVVDNYKRPSWTHSQEVIDNFKASLIEREIERREPGWYMHMPDFVDAWVHSADHAKQFNNIVKQLPETNWWSYAPVQHLLQYGRFPGFIWP